MKNSSYRKLHIGRILPGIIIFLLSVALFGSSIAEAADEIRIGYTPQLSGGHSSPTPHEVKAIKLALKQINEGGGVNGKKINLIIVDNQSSTSGAQAAVKKVVEEEKMLALVGFILSTYVMATSDAIRTYGIPTCIGGSHASLTRRGNPWLFRVRPDDSIGARAIVKYIGEDMKLRKIGILHDSDASGTGAADLVERGAKERGIAVVKREKYASRERGDFTARLLSLKEAGAEIMVMWGYPIDAAHIQRQYRQIGSPFKYIGSAGSQMKSNLDIAGEAADGLLAIAEFVPGQSEANRKYIEAYKKEYNEDCDPTMSWVYDALNILVEAIKKAGEDRVKIREAILALKGYQGVMGTFSFTPNGDGLHGVNIVQIEKGKPKLLKFVSVEAE